MRRARRRMVLLIAGFVLTGLVSAGNEDEQAGLSLREPELPVPPEQRAAWEPAAAGLPEPALPVVKILFEQGMADPRGCEYREVEVVSGNVWDGRPRLVKTRGWVLPGEDMGRRFVVCWNGWVYPAVTVGDGKDLADDVEATLKAHAEARARWEKERPDFPFTRFDTAGEGLEPAGLSGVSVCLLLRLGRADLAGRLYEAIAPPPGRGDAPGNDPYLAWASDWLWAQFSRTVTALGRGDDNLALAGARELVRVHPLVEAEATRRGFERRTYSDSRRRNELQPHVAFLSQVPELASDLERRVKDGVEPPPVSGQGDRFRADPARVEQLKAKPVPELITELENVRGRKWGQPGGIEWENDPVVAAFIAKGEEAVPALLDAWENDQRLTRTVDFGRDFHRGRHVVPVKQVAEVCLAGILEMRFESVTEARGYWEKTSGIPQEERWYATLADDSAGKDRWLQAAGRIVQPTDVTTTVSGWVVTPNRNPEDVPGLRGEKLREKRSPTVLELMARRAAEILAQGRPGTQRTWAMRDGCRMALAAAPWDPDGAKPLLAEQSLRASAFLEEQGAGTSSSDEQIGRELANLTVARVKAGDDEAFVDYARFLRRFEPAKVSARLPEYLAPLWRFPDHPDGRALAEELFLGTGSEWNPVLQKLEGYSRPQELIDSPMLGVEAFRRQLLSSLADESPAGTFTRRSESERRTVSSETVTENGKTFTRIKSDWLTPGLGWARSLLNVDEADPRAPATGARVEVRLCDIYAAALSETQGLPWVGWYWPLPDLDAARAELVQRLERYGGRYRHSSVIVPGEFSDGRRARMTFPGLDRPATEADVERGLAVFSLEGEGERRLASDPKPPFRARWRELRDRPVLRQRSGKNGNGSETEIGYVQEGIVWQAEEVLKDGAWVRYYGFVGRHALARVPAEQLEVREPTAGSSPP